MLVLHLDLAALSAGDWAKWVQASVAPVVIISASALMCLALYNRLAAIISRMRAVQRERLEITEKIDNLTSAETAHGHGARLTCIAESLAEQTSRIRRRARLVRNSLLSLLVAIGLLVVCSLLNGMVTFTEDVAVVAAAVFVLGLLCMLLGVAFAAIELTSALAPAEFETDVVSELTGTGDHENATGRPRLKIRRDESEEEAPRASAGR
jgi:hypothetical protein